MFDTLSYAKRLKAAGFSEAQAEAQAEALAEAVGGALVTRHDLSEASQQLSAVWAQLDHFSRKPLLRCPEVGGLILILVEPGGNRHRSGDRRPLTRREWVLRSGEGPTRLLLKPRSSFTFNCE